MSRICLRNVVVKWRWEGKGGGLDGKEIEGREKLVAPVTNDKIKYHEQRKKRESKLEALYQ